MAKTETATLDVSSRTPDGSRGNRRLRREGFVPGVVYGGGEEPLSFSVEARTLRNALHGAGAVLELSIDGEHRSPVVLKHQQRHPVTGETVHVDMLRVNLNVAIQAVVPLVLLNGEESPGAKEGGVVEQVIRELNIEALPNEIPDEITLDISEADIGHTETLAAVKAPPGVTILDDPEIAIYTLSAPRLVTEGELEIEEETGVVGEGEGEGEAGEAAESEEASAEDSGGDE